MAFFTREWKVVSRFLHGVAKLVAGCLVPLKRGDDRLGREPAGPALPGVPADHSAPWISSWKNRRGGSMNWAVLPSVLNHNGGPENNQALLEGFSLVDFLPQIFRFGVGLIDGDERGNRSPCVSV